MLDIIWFKEKSRCIREEDNEPIAEGIEEDNEFDDNIKYERHDSLPISEGIGDENLFLLRSRNVSDTKEPIVDGRADFNRFPCISQYCKLAKYPTAVGTLPVILRFGKLMFTTMYSMHLTPVHEHGFGEGTIAVSTQFHSGNNK